MKCTFTATLSEVTAAVMGRMTQAEIKAKLGLPADAELVIVADQPEVKYRELGKDEVVAHGDEWKLKDGLSHKDGKAVEWRVVGDAAGYKASKFAKSVFRRKI